MCHILFKLLNYVIHFHLIQKIYHFQNDVLIFFIYQKNIFEYLYIRGALNDYFPLDS